MIPISEIEKLIFEYENRLTLAIKHNAPRSTESVLYDIVEDLKELLPK